MSADRAQQPVLCFCNSNRAWGGGEKWHLEAALAMAERGAQVIVAAGNTSPLFERASQHPQLDTAAFRFSSLGFLNPFAVISFAVFLKKHHVTHLVLGLPADLKAGGLAAKLAGVPHVIYRRGSALPVRNTALNRFLYGAVLTGLIVNSRETMRLVLSNNPQLIPQERIHLLPNGIDIDDFDASLALAEPIFRGEDEPQELCLIGNAGRLTEQKGQKYLLHMAAALRQGNFPFKLILAGDGELRDELQKLAQSLNVTKHVAFIGFQKQLAPFWRSIDIFVLSSLWEGFGYVLAEAMLAKKPVLAFNANSMPEIVKHGSNGELIPFPAEDENDMVVGKRIADAVLNLAAAPERSRAMGETGRRYCMEHYNQKHAMDTLYTLLHQKEAPCPKQ